jgi:LmbE family N-acetylglucosaminyl deacetylase
MLSPELKEIRTIEAEKVASILGVTKLIQKDFGDGEIAQKRDLVLFEISKLLEDTKPDLVVTYDLSGLYGHEDHVVTSEIVTALLEGSSTTKLWYVTLPKRVSAMSSLPEHMAKDAAFASRRSEPNLKVFSLPYTMRKIRAVYAYESQVQSYKNSLPVKFLPLWFFYSMPVYEYFYEVSYLESFRKVYFNDFYRRANF